MNCQLRKIKMPDYQSTHNQENQKKYYHKSVLHSPFINDGQAKFSLFIILFTFSRFILTLKIETNKMNQVLSYISKNNVTELNELIYARAKLVCEKIGITSKSTKKKSKQGWEIRLEMQIKYLWEQVKIIKQKKDAGICWKSREKATREKNSTTRGNKPKSTGERRKPKKISIKGKTIQKKQDIPKQRKKISSTTVRRWHKNIPATGCKRNRTILD